VYIFSVLYYLTDHGKDLRAAQYIFAVLYLLSLFVIFDIYRRVKKVGIKLFYCTCNLIAPYVELPYGPVG
jgi:alpha-1,3-mannosyltransferase